MPMKILLLFSLICLLRNGHAGPITLHVFPPGTLELPQVLSVVFKCFENISITDQITFLCVHTPRGHIYLRFLPPPPPLSDENPVMLHFFAYAEIIFAHILVFPACAIEVQHTNENSPPILGIFILDRSLQVTKKL